MVTEFKTIASLGIVLVIAATFTGCRNQDYADTINLDAGDAIATNKAIQTIDPWPRSAFKKRHSTNGQRVMNAYDKYLGATVEPANGR